MTYDVLVHNCGESEDHDHGDLLRQLCSSCGVVNMTDKPVVDGEVPLTPVLPEVARVPPVVVEAAV